MLHWSSFRNTDVKLSDICFSYPVQLLSVPAQLLEHMYTWWEEGCERGASSVRRTWILDVKDKSVWVLKIVTSRSWSSFSNRATSFQYTHTHTESWPDSDWQDNFSHLLHLLIDCAVKYAALSPTLLYSARSCHKHGTNTHVPTKQKAPSACRHMLMQIAHTQTHTRGQIRSDTWTAVT